MVTAKTARPTPTPQPWLCYEVEVKASCLLLIERLDKGPVSGPCNAFSSLYLVILVARSPPTMYLELGELDYRISGEQIKKIRLKAAQIRGVLSKKFVPKELESVDLGIG